MLDSPLPARPGEIKAKVLVLHGDDDPLAPIEQVIAFRNEMRSAKANWEMNIYSAAGTVLQAKEFLATRLQTPDFIPRARQGHGRPWLLSCTKS
jgi:hypothetical protein